MMNDNRHPSDAIEARLRELETTMGRLSAALGRQTELLETVVASVTKAELNVIGIATVTGGTIKQVELLADRVDVLEATGQRSSDGHCDC